MEVSVMDIPVNAIINCTDGECGKTDAVIIDPLSKKITHIIVKGKDIPEGRLVGISEMKETTEEAIFLNLSIAELYETEAFTETQYVKTDVPVDVNYDIYNLPYVQPMSTETIEVPIDKELIPPGELAIHRGTPVEAKEGYIGDIGEFLIDPDSGKISHIVLLKGHLWGRKEVSLPISVIDQVLHNTVYLKLEKKSIEMLPEIPIHRDYSQQEIREKKHEVIASVYDKPDGAEDTLTFLNKLCKSGVLDIKHAAVMVKDRDGNIKVEERGDIGSKQGAIFGAISGGLIGLLGGPIGVIVGAAAGAATGGVAARKIDMGFSNDFLDKVQEELQPGKSALIVVVEHEMVEDLSSALSDLEGLHFNQEITDEFINELISESTGDQDKNIELK
jgi:uncharacterized membrane protein